MDTGDQITQFENEVEAVIVRFRQEYELPYAAMIGSLALKQHELCQEAIDSDDDTPDKKN
jgi:hypothetical protein